MLIDLISLIARPGRRNGKVFRLSAGSIRRSVTKVEAIALPALLVAAVAGALVGCGQLPSAEQSPTPTSTSTSEASPTPSIVPLPGTGGAGSGGGSSGGGGSGEGGSGGGGSDDARSGGGGGGGGGGNRDREPPTDPPDPGRVVLPNVLGLPVGEAKRTLENAGLAVKVGAPVASPEAAGNVVKQSPDSGGVSRGTTVTITPSRGLNPPADDPPQPPPPQPEPAPQPPPPPPPPPEPEPEPEPEPPQRIEPRPRLPLPPDEDDGFPPVCRVKPDLPQCE